ncbi:heterokaryon incompatibility protein-domain-containing protein [Podospora didyma]|uniref:Heterokaryon incompatibility protein-domain-containing protein n=1 Tax=Podospora didyma TaxID=330526 RepID=A0AAE0NHW9_9PEZI|nr:heterokaryon incompatibility protein-domain-containing protein [Podospora didyma]
MICSVCQASIQQAASNVHSESVQRQPIEHHYTLNTFKRSLDEGCGVMSAKLGRREEAATFLFSFSTPHKHQSRSQLTVGPNLFWKHPQLAESRIYFHPPRELDPCTGSLATIALAKRWVTDCVANHDSCKTKDGWYPTRLLEIGQRGSSEQSVRLIETNVTSLTGNYMTLTHRWGSADQLTLTVSSYPRMLEGIPVALLPPLFRDVIFVTQELGVHHIWIDSLCIIQDQHDAEDWHREASLMHNVYSNSFCNISATDAGDCTESIFHIRDPSAIVPQRVKIMPGNGGGESETKFFSLHYKESWVSEVSSAPVNKRGWAFQERFSAPRILQFGRRQLLWECFEKDAAEVYPDGLPLSLRKVNSDRFKCLDPEAIWADSTLQYGRLKPGSGEYMIWSRIVNRYATCQLTFPRDKLIAISGLAKRVASILQDNYVAGMWRRNLENELLWAAADARQTSRPTEYRAPTWSWTSVDGDIHPGTPRLEPPLIQVEDCQLTYETPDTTGGVTGGWLRLKGAVRGMKLVRQTATAFEHKEDCWDMVIEGVNISIFHSFGRQIEPRVMLDVFQHDFA